jgi:branched-chain amino acid transport system ATP-binding protein
VSAPVLQVNDVTTGYRGVNVVHGVSLSVEPGEVVALLGPNGAGKTTTLLTIAGVLRATGGTIEVLGQRSERIRTSRLAKDGMVLVPEDRGLFGQLSVADTLRLAQRSRVRRSDNVIGLLPALAPLWRRKVALLSGGEQQMVALAAALVRRPRLLMLDEMSLGLAPQIVSQLLAAVRRMADQDGTGVLLVEQHARIALDACDYAVILKHGEVSISGTPEQVRAQLHTVEDAYLGDDSPHADRSSGASS